MRSSSSSESCPMTVDSGSSCRACSGNMGCSSPVSRALGTCSCKGAGIAVWSSLFIAPTAASGTSAASCASYGGVTCTKSFAPGSTVGSALLAACACSAGDSSSSDESAVLFHPPLLDDLVVLRLPRLFRRCTARADAIAAFQRALGLKCSRRPVDKSCSVDASCVVSH